MFFARINLNYNPGFESYSISSHSCYLSLFVRDQRITSEGCCTHQDICRKTIQCLPCHTVNFHLLLFFGRIRCTACRWKIFRVQPLDLLLYGAKLNLIPFTTTCHLLVDRSFRIAWIIQSSLNSWRSRLPYKSCHKHPRFLFTLAYHLNRYPNQVMMVQSWVDVRSSPPPTVGPQWSCCTPLCHFGNFERSSLTILIRRTLERK